MSTINASDVKRLRDMTDLPMKDCKKALEENQGDMEKAKTWLRMQFKDKAGKKAEREAAEGRIFIAIAPDHSGASIVELRCESAPVAKAERFVKLGEQIAAALTTGPIPSTLDNLHATPLPGGGTVHEALIEQIGTIGENMKVARFAALRGGPFGAYIHFDGSVGVLLQTEGTPVGDPAEILKDVCMHITATQPIAVRKEEVDPALIAKEREIAQAQAAGTGKPEKVVAMIVENKIKTWLSENCLVEQAFVKDNTKTIEQVLSPTKLRPKRFVRFKVGELGGTPTAG